MAFNSRLTRVLREVRRWRGSGSDVPLQVDPDLASTDLRRLSAEVGSVIGGRGGQAAARRRARRVGLTYGTLSATGRQRFFEHLAAEHDRDREAVNRAIDTVIQADDPERRRSAERELRHLLRPGYETLLRHLAGQGGGLAFLVALRADLLPHRSRSPELTALDAELHQILENWFDVGLLELVQLTWDTSASLLEKLIEYEAVHAIESWDDLKRRLGPGRRCYAFVHPGMPDDPLIFVEVALTSGIPDRLGPLLEPRGSVADGLDPAVDRTEGAEDPDEDAESAEANADTAVFYSISNCHRGLAGVSLGDFLIKSVAEELSAELPELSTFATLSPLPGFHAWLQAEAADDSRTAGPVALSRLRSDAQRDRADDSSDTDVEDGAVWAELGELLDRRPASSDDSPVDALRPIIEHLAARYVTSRRADGRAIDPVAHFHLSNGAKVERLNWMANPTPTGWERGLGLMVNYRYDLPDIEENHERYVAEGDVALGDQVKAMLERRGGDGRRRWR